MFYEPNGQNGATLYKLLTGTVIPRPIAWVATLDENGISNLAPFSFFNVAGEDPPHLMFSTVRTGNTNKDTLNNILATQEFVVNLVTEEVVEKMNRTAEAVAPEVNEFELAQLTPIPSVKVKPFRVQESPVHFECQLVHHYFLEDHHNGGACIIIGKIVALHIADAIVMENDRINLEVYKPVARLAGSNYSTIGNVFSIKRN